MAKKAEDKKKDIKKKDAKKSGSDAQRELLAKELKSLIPKLDSEGLAFLVEQARVHLYNMQVDELNEAAIAADSARQKSRTISGKAKSSDGTMRIDATESGSSFYLQYRNDNIMFSRDEMIHLVKIANGDGSDLEIRERLYAWFDRERRDIFSLVPIANKFDDKLKSLSALIKKNFKVR